jgi:hypothetical protein
LEVVDLQHLATGEEDFAPAKGELLYNYYWITTSAQRGIFHQNTAPLYEKAPGSGIRALVGASSQ